MGSIADGNIILALGFVGKDAQVDLVGDDWYALRDFDDSRFCRFDSGNANDTLVYL